MSDIASRVKAIIVEKLGVDENEITDDANFTTDLGADSLDTVELIMEFEKEFDIQIPDDQAEQIQTVGQAIKFIEDYLKNKN
ncbi:MAG: acyl carrier protein [Chlorobi bacterium]|nr:acyl carrier protein [Chlorobiota bacterium]